jgi:hypothetical protein
MVTYPEIGERFCKQLIGTILDVKLDKIRIVPQKVYLGADTNLHGARLDVYIEEEDDELSGTLFDVEPDKNEKESLKKALPQRGRFYHSMLDQECLKSGQGYEALKRVVVMMLRDIHKMVTKVKQDSGVTLEYMKIFEREKMLYEDGKEEGRLEKLVSLVFKKLRKNCDVCEIADMLEEDEHLIRRICDAAKKYAPDYDEEKCAELLEQLELTGN